MSKGINNKENNSFNKFKGFLLDNEMIKGLIQMADIQYSIFMRFLDLTNGDIEAAEKQTFIFMKALNAGNKKDNNSEE